MSSENNCSATEKYTRILSAKAIMRKEVGME